MSPLKPPCCRFVPTCSSYALDALKKLSTPIDSFFDSVMVMDEDLTLRKNRLALLKAIDELIAKIADFGKIVLQ